MYGMVNNSIRSFILENHGPETWETIAENAGIDPGEFGAVLSYDDALTSNIIQQCSSATGIPVDDFLRQIGRYWVHFAASSSFGSLLTFGGKHFEEFLSNLDAIHSKIKASLPELAPPSFRVESVSADTVCVCYSSHRNGLFPFVEGLFVGLSEHFDQSVEILDFQALGPNKAKWHLRLGQTADELVAAQ